MKKFKTPLLLSIAILFLFCLHAKTLFAGMYDPKLGYKTIITEHFKVHYPKEIEETAQRVARLSEEAFTILAPKFKWVPMGKTEMIVSDASDKANGMASVLPYNWMFIRVAAPSPDISLSSYDDWLRLLIIHEYTHIVHLDKYRGFWTPLRVVFGKLDSPNGVSPGWIKEGLAVYEETRETGVGRINASYGNMLTRTAVLNDDLMAIDEADGDQWSWPSIQARYIYGGKFMQFLAENYGEDKLYEFVRRTSGSPLLFTVNRQAKKTFTKSEYEFTKIHTRFDREKKEGAPKAKSFYLLWKDWQRELKQKHNKEIDEIVKNGETPFSVIATAKQTVTNAVISPDGTKIVYSIITPFGPPSIMIADADGSNAKKLIKNTFATQISYSSDGSFIVYAKIGAYKKYNFVYDLYKYEFDTKKLTRLTTGARADYPDISPDGKKVVCVTQKAGSEELKMYDMETKELSTIPLPISKYTQLANPRFSPDGTKIVVAGAAPGYVWDIYIVNEKGKILTRVTADYALERDPVWSPDGKAIYFASDRTGVSNIYRYDLKEKRSKRITNVITGVFEPVITPDGNNLMVQYYNGSGFDLRKWLIDDSSVFHDRYHKKILEGKAYASTLPYAKTPAAAEMPQSITKKYSSFGSGLLLPRFLMPGLLVLDDALIFTAMTGGADPLRWHNWTAGASYRTDAKFFGYNANYWYDRFKPSISVSFNNYAVEFGRFTTRATGRVFQLYEKRKRVDGGIAYPWRSSAFSIRYFYEDRQPQTSLTAAERAAFNFGKYAGFGFGFGYDNSKQYPASISTTSGRKVKMAFTLTNAALGAAKTNEQYVFAGDWREYIGLWGRQVLALRVGGGMTWGDQFLQGTYSLGGSLGEGVLAGVGSLYYFPLRGLPLASFSNTRAMLFSSEYRFPLINGQRGLGTLPFFLQDIHFAIFADYGNTWAATTDTGKYFFDNFFLGTGAEIRADFVIGYGLPVRGRLGYGIIVVNRDRLGTLQDPLMKHAADKGVAILQFGTAF